MKSNYRKKKKPSPILGIAVGILLLFSAGNHSTLTNIVNQLTGRQTASTVANISSVNIDALPTFQDTPYVTVNHNRPNFSKSQLIATSSEKYYTLDAKKRATGAFAVIGKDLFPRKKRGDISHIYPTGWKQGSYSFIENHVLYNRCHLIAHSLTAEDDNPNNLITGTRYLNIEGMLPFETKVLRYIRATHNHVAYQVIPIYKNDNLLASGVEMQAYSIEDNGAGISFHVYCYNVQPGVKILYRSGVNYKA